MEQSLINIITKQNKEISTLYDMFDEILDNQEHLKKLIDNDINEIIKISNTNNKELTKRIIYIEDSMEHNNKYIVDNINDINTKYNEKMDKQRENIKEKLKKIDNTIERNRSYMVISLRKKKKLTIEGISIN